MRMLGKRAFPYMSSPEAILRILRLPDVEGVLKELADSFSPDEIGDEAYHLYEQFRPNVVPGQQGWGRKGRLEFDRILELKK